MRKEWWLAAVCLVLWYGCTTVEVSAPPQPVVRTRELMRSVLSPNANIIWNAVKTVGTYAGVEEVRPTTDAEWLAVRNAAVTIAEGGRMLMRAPRADKGSRWARAAQRLIDSTTAVVGAADTRDADRLLVVGGEMYEACLTCHQSYMSE